MKRRTRTIPVKVYTYGCLAPTVGAEVVHDQMRRCTAYKHALIEIELWAREQYRVARRELDGSVAKAEADKAEAERAYLAMSDEAKENKLSRVERVQLLAPLRATLNAAKDNLKEARANAKEDPAVKARAEEIAAERTARVKTARSVSGAYWGSYLLVEKAHEAMMKACAKNRMDPRHRTWNGNGRIGIQAQQPLTTAEVFAGTSTLLRIERLPFDHYQTRRDPNSHRSHLRQRALVHIRVGSTEKQEPIWATFPVLLHRELPEGRITWAWVKATRVGFRTRYDLQITIESDNFPAREEGRSGKVDLDLCWEQCPEGVLVGRLSDGTEYVVPQVVIDKVVHARVGVRGPCDSAFDDARKGLIAWLHANEDKAPEWLVEWSQHAARWNRHGKLRQIAEQWSVLQFGENAAHTLWLKWVKERLASEAKIYGTWETVWGPLNDFCAANGIDDPVHRFVLRLYWWRQQDTHLTQWEADETRKALLRRKDIYRVWARRAASRYSAVRIDTRNLAEEAEQEKGTIDATVRQLVAPAELRDAFAMAFGHRCERLGDAKGAGTARSADNTNTRNETAVA